jgi:lipoprotein-releasing system ATP-binding protein
MIRYPAWEYWKRRREFAQTATDILRTVGLDHRLKHRPCELSGGEMQRAAIARALVGRPEVLLADEPTGNLDARTGREIMELLGRLNDEERLTIIMVTHDDAVAQRAERIVRLSEGRIQTLPEAA